MIPGMRSGIASAADVKSNFSIININKLKVFQPIAKFINFINFINFNNFNNFINFININDNIIMRGMKTIFGSLGFVVLSGIV